MRIVAVDELNNEMKLARDVIDPESGRVLLGAGASGLPHYSSRFRAIGVGYLYVDDPCSAGIEIPPSVSDEIRAGAEQALDLVYEKCEMEQNPDYRAVKQTVKDLIGEILANPEILVNVYEMRARGGDFLGHSVNVAFLSLLLANRLGYGAENMRKLGLGALLHDIGVAGMPQSLLRKKNALSAEEKFLYEQHAVLGYQRVKDSWEIPPLSRNVILCHHERADGSGYPHHLLKGDIHEFSRIVGLADCFEELTGGHPFSRQISIQETMELLAVKGCEWFDRELVSKFGDCIPTCQNGTTVRLNDGRTAVVTAQNRGFPTRPVVRVIQDAEGNRIDPAQEINLLENNHLVLV